MADTADDRLKEVEERIEALEAERGEQALVIETRVRRDQNTDAAEQAVRDIQAALVVLHAERAGLLQSSRRGS